MKNLLSHGGYIYGLLKDGLRYEDILDFSSSINPLGMPKVVKTAIKDHIDLLLNYPDPWADELRDSISSSEGIEPDSTIAGNGSTELIYLIVRAFKPGKILLPQPTFSEYERAARSEGIEKIEYFCLKGGDNFDIPCEEFISLIKSRLSPAHMIFLCNPNNPTGRLIRKEDMLKIAEAAKRLQCYLVVDEAFIDFVPGESVIKEVKNNPYLIVLRSMTKFYGLAGLRLGYGVMSPGLCERLMRHKEPWTVNTLAQIAGVACLKDTEFKTKTLRTISQWKTYIEGLFERHRIRYVPAAANFYLFNLNGGTYLAHFLKKKGILIRDCSNFKGLEPLDGSGWFRIAVKSPADMERLFDGIAQYMKDQG